MVVVRRVIGKSMLPHFPPKAIVLGVRFRRPRLGDVVIAVQNGREVIKRVGALQANKYFLLGDNAMHSTDSRTCGWLEATAVKAIVVKRFL